MRKLATAVLLTVACAAAGPRKYPARPPSCKLAVYESPAPPVAAWDDLGVVEVGCHINTAQPQCWDRLRAEVCRLGGDIMYNVPRRPLRPKDEVVVWRVQVAHTRSSAKKEAEEPPPEMTKGPVAPLVAPSADAGAD